MTGAFIQVRAFGSDRMPTKTLAGMGHGLTMIEAVMLATRGMQAHVYALLTDEHSESALRPFADQYGFDLLVGHPTDVLSRYEAAVDTFSVQWVIRVCGDCPVVSPRLANGLVERAVEVGSDVAHHFDNPLGTGVDVIRAEAVHEASKMADDPRQREHVVPFMYDHYGQHFSVLEVQAPPECRGKGKVSVDIAADYFEMRRLFIECYRGKPIETEEVVEWLKANGR